MEVSSPLVVGRIHPTPATLTHLLSLKCAMHAPTPGLLHFPFSVPTIHVPEMACSHSSFRSLLQYHSSVRLTSSSYQYVSHHGFAYLSVYFSEDRSSIYVPHDHCYVPIPQHGTWHRKEPTEDLWNG